jgi:hypothetical protein
VYRDCKEQEVGPTRWLQKSHAPTFVILSYK